MDTAQWLVTLGGIALIALTLWFFFGKRSSTPSPSGNADIYACPMHPWITSATAGASCSTCGMALVRQDRD
jgi:LPXTG-motif cell wall-anchored protein